MWITDLDLKMLRALCKMQMFAPKWCKILSKWEILFSCSVRKARKQPQTGKQNTKNTNKMNRQFYPRPVSFCGFLAKRRLRIFMPLEVSAAGPGQRCRKIGAGVFQSRPRPRIKGIDFQFGGWDIIRNDDKLHDSWALRRLCFFEDKQTCGW
jgi:hypothetical protein